MDVWFFNVAHCSGEPIDPEVIGVEDVFAIICMRRKCQEVWAALSRQIDQLGEKDCKAISDAMVRYGDVDMTKFEHTYTGVWPPNKDELEKHAKEKTLRLALMDERVTQTIHCDCPCFNSYR